MMTKILVSIACIFLSVVAPQSQARININNLIPNNNGKGVFYPPPLPKPEITPKPPHLKIHWKTADSIMLKWKDRSYVEDGFRVELLDDGGVWKLIDNFGPLSSSYQTESKEIKDLFPNEEYCFRVVAYNDNGDSGDSSSAALQEACTYTTITTEKSCSGGFIEKVLEPATAKENSEILIQCDLTLQPGQIITKRLIFEGADASDITVDLNGATLQSHKGIDYRGKDRIEVRSKETVVKDDDEEISSYERPENITIKNGKIIGSVRIWGMSKNGEGDGVNKTEIVYEFGRWVEKKVEVPFTNQLKKSSRTSGHTARVQSNAPTNIVLDNLTITGVGRNPVYFAPGVTHSKLINSVVKGKSEAVAIYLDTESSENTIKNNTINVSTKNFISEAWDRPLIAIDGSSRNKIINNQFSNLGHGGIYLYRNCGEGGVIRHASPERNQIINNIFYYKKYTGRNPSVYLSSHDRGWIQRNFGFCAKDDGYPYGSSASDKDYVRNNVVMQNQFFERKVVEYNRGDWKFFEADIIPDYVKTSNPSINSPNHIADNQIVNKETVDDEQPAGCYVEMQNKGFIFHEESFDIYPSQCNGNRYTCDNGKLIKEPIVTYNCQLSSETITGGVVGVTDGDTLTVLVERQRLKVRIAGIDTPEKGQPFGQKAKTGLSNLVFGKQVRIEREKLDMYGRTIGKVFVDNTVDVGASLVAHGYAWVYTKYNRDQALYDYERLAKSKKLGIWALPKHQQIPPWEWRKKKNESQRVWKEFSTNNYMANQLANLNNNSACGKKRYCKEMSSCGEAMHYLNNCGLSKLDGNGDGKPCEQLCK